MNDPQVSAETEGYNYSQVLSTHCHSPIKHTVTATGQLKTTVVSFVPDLVDLNRTEIEIEKTDCSVWTVTSEINPSELTVIINSLMLAPNDSLFVISEDGAEAVCYNYSLTTQHDLFPKEVTSRHPIVLTWVRQVFQDYDVEPRKQRLAFSFLAVGGSDPSLEEKERVVLMGAIVISLFTVVATVLSITRSTRCSCCRPIGVFFKNFQKPSNGTSGVPPADERLRFDQSDIRGGNGHEETMILMEMEAPRNDPSVFSPLANGNEESGHRGWESATLVRERNGLLTTEFSHISDNDEERNESGEDFESGNRMYYNASGIDAENYVITVPSPGMNHSGQGHGRNDSSRPQEPSLSELLGELPVYSPTPQRSAVAAARSSPFAFMTSLLPSRLHRQQRPFSSASTTSSTAFPGTHPHPYVHSSPVHPDTTAPPGYGQVHFTIGGHHMLGASRGHHHPTDFSSSVSRLAQEVESNLGESPPPPYSELPPPAYSALFPNSC